MNRRVSNDLGLLRAGLTTLHEAALTGNVTVIVIDEVTGALTGDLPTLIVKMENALRRVAEVIERRSESSSGKRSRNGER